ncbi:MAG TPA: HAMP domain-containing sensor histidine kinase [Streptosporangiaceae bacterium]|nr:HAMP domain-containing sensor histidine kinase [Streptosporangiaceae bacterium]
MSDSDVAGQDPGNPFTRWIRRRTLRGRLIAGLLALLAVACAAIGLTTYLALHSALMGQLDTQLQAASQRYRQCVEAPVGDSGDGPGNAGMPPGTPDSDHDVDNVPHDMQTCAQHQGPATFSAVITTGKIQSPTVVGRDRWDLTSADKEELTDLPAEHGADSVTFSSLGPYRLTASPGGDGSTLVTGLPLAPVQGTMRDVAMTEIIVFGAALLLTGVIGTGFVRLSLRPLRRVAATASRVTELPLASGDVRLTERVPDANPRTEVGQVGTAFNRMLGHVESALGRRAASEARLRRFAADASHELRTPLAAIRGYAELALRNQEPIPDDIRHALGRVESESERMSVLVDELLLLAQLDAGRPLACEPVDLTRLAIDATSDARVAAPGHRWMLELPDEPIVVQGDEHRLHQVIANLMSNAAKHTPKGTTVTLSLGPASDPGEVQLKVTDDGPGIPAELQPTLFERFVRGDSARSHLNGSTGLGLAIVDAVTAAHGGRVSLRSEPGRTQFKIVLPRAGASSATPAL